MSLPPFKFKPLLPEEWDSSVIHDYFEETKFLFIIYKKQNNQYVFSHAKFWNMPISDLEGDTKAC